jgi:hypothetical protein
MQIKPTGNIADLLPLRAASCERAEGESRFEEFFLV